MSEYANLYDFTPVTNGVISSSWWYIYMQDFTPVPNGVISSSQHIIYRKILRR